MPDFAAIPAQVTINPDGSATLPAGLNFRGEWDAFFGYSAGNVDCVIWNGIAYICYVDVPAIVDADPLFQGIPQIGRAAAGQTISGLITSTDPTTSPATYPAGNPIPYHCQVWTFNVTTAGTFTVSLAPGNAAAGPTFDCWKPNGTGLFSGANNPFPFNPETFTPVGIYHIVVRSTNNAGNSDLAPKSYSFSITAGTGVAGAGTGNPSPDVDTAHWTPTGI